MSLVADPESRLAIMKLHCPKNHEILKSLLASHPTVHSSEIQKNMDVIQCIFHIFTWNINIFHFTQSL